MRVVGFDRQSFPALRTFETARSAHLAAVVGDAARVGASAARPMARHTPRATMTALTANSPRGRLGDKKDLPSADAPVARRAVSASVGAAFVERAGKATGPTGRRRDGTPYPTVREGRASEAVRR